MALYGSNFYNLFTYGAETLADFDARPIFSNPTDYKTISVWWTKPSGDWSDFVLVRSSLGFPVTPDDGITLITTTFADHDSLQLPYVDVGADFVGGQGLAEGQTYYYSVFVKRTSDSAWFRAGNTLCISVKDYGTASLMYNYLPTPYKVTDFNTALTPSPGTNTDLYNFLKVFAFEYDLIKTTAENVKNRYNIRLLDGRLIPLMMDQFGWTYESEMGIAQGRRLLEYAAQIYMTKGSVYGVKAFAKAFSGYGVSLGTATNLMLTQDDSSFEDTIGSWDTVTNGTATAITGAAESPVVPPYAESTAPSNFPNLQAGILKIAASASGGTVSTSCGESAPVTKGIPITASTAYTFSIYARSKVTARVVSLNIRWYDRDGVFISAGTAATTTTSTSAWARLNKITATAPSTAQFAVPTISIASTAANEVHYFDAAQFQLGSSVTDFVDARRVDIYLQPNRINYIKNCTFEGTVTTAWNPRNCTLAASSTQALFNTKSLRATVGSSATSAGASVTATTTYMPPVVPGKDYTYSVYVKDYDTAKSYKSYIDWYDSSGTYMSAGVSGTTTAVSTTEWTRVTVSGVAPAGAAYARPYTYSSTSFDAGDAGKIVYFDGALFEPGNVVNPYFDGYNGYKQASDLLWENNDPVLGRSMYYKNRSNTTLRLKNIMGDYIDVGSPWALFTGTII